MITPENVLNILFIGTCITVILFLVIAGQYQELKAKRNNRNNIRKLQASNVIRKGH